jgi:RNA polymerase subunit RPABC4/transcription elongation factor Spt4
MGNASNINSLLILIIGFGAAFVIAFWVSLVIWTYRDIRSRSHNRFIQILAVLLSAILFLPGVLVYLILRPPQTIEAEYQKALEEEALYQTIEDKAVCPGCGRQVEKDWMVCASCHTRLKKPCQHCKQLLELFWNLCPYCGTPVPGARKTNQTMEEATHNLPLFEETENSTEPLTNLTEDESDS